MDIKKLWNILLLLLVANIALGAEVSGRVIDYGTKKAIDFANVSVEKPSVNGQPSELITGAITDTEGKFVLNLKDGNYTLVTNTSGSYPDPVYRIQTIAEGMSTSVLAFPDETLSLGEIDFTFLLPAEYPGLRIKHVSSVFYGALYFGFGLMIAALYLCFFMVPAAVSVREDGYSVVSPKEVQEIREALTIAGKEEEP